MSLFCITHDTGALDHGKGGKMSTLEQYADGALWLDASLNDFMFPSTGRSFVDMPYESLYMMPQPELESLLLQGSSSSYDASPDRYHPSFADDQETACRGGFGHHQAGGRPAAQPLPAATSTSPLSDRSWTGHSPRSDSSSARSIGPAHSAASASLPGLGRRRRRSAHAATAAPAPAPAPVPVPVTASASSSASASALPSAPAPLPSPSRAGKHSGQRSKTLERNRIAATNFRKRSKESVNQLETTKAQLQSKHDELRSEFSKLTEEVLQLKNDLMSHAVCHDSRIDRWIRTEAQKFTRKLSSAGQSCQGLTARPAAQGCYDTGGSPETSDGFASVFPCSPIIEGDKS
ncbi:uncharacterized protein UV8b_06997 [Ustilaginoidea virens]|uniref:BZIP domain-containing protein n=1 Tax=Ustilaginoidea virens TaxID=1159556 RepID=A0A063CBQ4_USTVR|nr:uncharacterized protein UV8b_06997 [Ustilaginoidea virens]QUC22756.1 hypothetical protein UV8b_06997 [Ustilaginoidea virens]GAO16507.1 hypothetical protein UVI_02010860 [Ustilaginoidea virens]